MTDDHGSSLHQSVTMRTTRMEAFSDGVFAIAITLLVLEIVVPPDSGDDLLAAVLRLWPSYLAYLISFATIGAIWLGHIAITHYVHQTNGAFLRLNLCLLLVVAFLPFPTRLLAEYTSSREAERVAATIYGCTLLAAALLLSALWRHAVRAQLVRPDVGDREVQLLTKRLTPGLAGYLIFIAAGTLWPMLAVFGYLAVAVYLLLPVTSSRSSRRPA